ncbi:MAG TPA: ABC transporter substrate-binding protein [Chloroflexota bacterium]|nr:ABC transporter substrate-binding protein [Chloroflexota bacterium]
MSLQSRRYPKSRAVGSALVAAAVVFSGLALRPSMPAHAASNTLLVARDISDGKTMDPGHSYEFTAAVVQSNTYDTLVTYNGTDTAHPVGDLATSWKVNSDGTVYTFNLRKNVRFSNGDPLTADDVVFSYLRLKYLNDNPAFLIAGATNIKALDKYTVQITLGAPDVSFLAALADQNFGVLDSKLVKAHGGVDSSDAATKDKAESFLDSQSAGTGPYKMTNWTRNSQIVLERNPNYFGPRAAFDKIIFQHQISAAQQRLLVQRGSVDIAMNVSLQQAQPLLHDPNVKVVTGNTLDLIYLAMTTSMTRSVPLSSKYVRQAVRYAIDYDGILKGLLKGVGTRPNSMIPVGMLGNDTATNNSLLIHQDLNKARALMKRAGYSRGFTTSMYYTVGATVDGVAIDPLASKIQNDLAQIGITIKLVPQQDSVNLAEYRAQKLPMILYNWGVDYADPDDYAGPFSPGGGPAKRMFYTWDSKLANIVAQAKSSTDNAKRVALYRQVQQTWLDESPWVGLVQPQNIIVLGSNIKGYVFSPLTLGGNLRSVHK